MSRIQQYALVETTPQHKDTPEKEAPAKKPRKAKKTITPKPPVIPSSAKSLCSAKNPEEPAKPAPGPIPPSASANNEPADNLKQKYDEWLKEFFADNHSENLKLLCKNFGLKPTDLPRLRELANMVVGEWILSRLEKPNYTEWSRHLISAMRQKNIATKTTINQQSHPAADIDYSYNGGFGGTDV